MQDLISRQAAIDMFQRMAYDDWNQGTGTTWANAFSEAADMIEDLPPEDAVEVVRCRDCIWRYHDVIDGEEMDWCGVWANQTQEDVFCSYGKGATNG